MEEIMETLHEKKSHQQAISEVAIVWVADGRRCKSFRTLKCIQTTHQLHKVDVKVEEEGILLLPLLHNCYANTVTTLLFRKAILS